MWHSETHWTIWFDEDEDVGWPLGSSVDDIIPIHWGIMMEVERDAIGVNSDVMESEEAKACIDSQGLIYLQFGSFEKWSHPPWRCIQYEYVGLYSKRTIFMYDKTDCKHNHMHPHVVMVMPPGRHWHSILHHVQPYYTKIMIEDLYAFMQAIYSVFHWGELHHLCSDEIVIVPDLV